MIINAVLWEINLPTSYNRPKFNSHACFVHVINVASHCECEYLNIRNYVHIFISYMI